ncbi:LysR family transcriptional regulator [Arcobacter sp. CECT 8986]|uniref:LysR family transcriptional regulator n=1 Tax=Arcobacter sp. CECT 8986 TaxID=2044507 RepID=UPI0013E91624|nr:LysR family transcriptional regulator [Arcobacter sp. CECT 8986]
MDSHLLKVFVAVAKKGNISQAAIELDCAQSNVTSRIKQLEKNLDIKLFNRVSKGVKLTYEGEKLYPDAVEIIHKLEEAEAKIKNLNKQEILKVSSTQVNAPIRLVPFISKLKKDFPEKKIELYTNTSLLVIDSILNYDVDIGFICGKTEHKDIKILKEFEEELYIVEALNDNIQNCVFTYIDSCIYYIYLASLLRNEGNNDFETVTIENYETILACVELGMGRAILPINLIKKYGYENKLKLKKVDDSNTNFSTCLICRKDNEPNEINYFKNIEL